MIGSLSPIPARCARPAATYRRAHGLAKGVEPRSVRIKKDFDLASIEVSSGRYLARRGHGRVAGGDALDVLRIRARGRRRGPGSSALGSDAAAGGSGQPGGREQAAAMGPAAEPDAREAR